MKPLILLSNCDKAAELLSAEAKREGLTFDSLVMPAEKAERCLAELRREDGWAVVYGCPPNPDGRLGAEGRAVPVRISVLDTAAAVAAARGAGAPDRPLALLWDETFFEPEVRAFCALQDALRIVPLADASRCAGAELLIPAGAVLPGGVDGAPRCEILPGPESVERAFRQLRSAQELSRVRTRLGLELDAVDSACFSGVIRIDSKGLITSMNESAKILLNCRNREMEGESIRACLKRLDDDVLRSVLVNGNRVFSLVLGGSRDDVILNIEPIPDGGAFRAILFLRQNIHKPQQGDPSKSVNRANGRFSAYVSNSELFRAIVHKAKLISYMDVPVLLLGEDGTENRGFANCIHNESSRRRNNFFEIECNAWSSENIDEILFGPYNAGDPRKPILDFLEGGTLFLNHIDSLTPEMQFRIYDLIKGSFFTNKDFVSHEASVRVVAYTNKNLRELVKTGAFRSDLYYALSVAALYLPPLRERKEDIRCITDIFMTIYGEKFSKPAHISESAFACMEEYSWPGNTRQLEYFCQKLLFSATSRNISEAMVREGLKSLEKEDLDSKRPESDGRQLDREERMIRELLLKNRGSKTRTAEDLGISRSTLWRRMQRYGIV